MKIVVIGAGVVGSSLAFRLAQAGQQVTLVDRAHPAYGTTGSSFAWINASTKTPEDYFELNVAGMVAHRTLRDELGGAPWLHEGGNLVWVDDDDAPELESRASRLRRWGYPVEELGRRQMESLEPNVRFEPHIDHAVLFATEAWIEGPRIAGRMSELAQDQGAETRFAHQVVEMTRGGDRITGVTLANGETIAADLVMNCAGPGADRVASLAGRVLPLAPTLGLVVRITNTKGAIHRVMHAPRVHMRPDANGLVMLHHGDADDAITRGEASNVWAEELLGRAREYVPAFADARVSRWSIGTRPIPHDERTSAGLLPAIPGYGEIVTHSGITLGPLLGRLVAHEITTGEIDQLLVPFRPERFL